MTPGTGKRERDKSIGGADERGSQGGRDGVDQAEESLLRGVRELGMRRADAVAEQGVAQAVGCGVALKLSGGGLSGKQLRFEDVAHQGVF